MATFLRQIRLVRERLKEQGSGLGDKSVAV